tara:strand:+ start:36794 stop:37054 length:261 start_codon:yes stop_codon:yes gene_type:complete
MFSFFLIIFEGVKKIDSLKKRKMSRAIYDYTKEVLQKVSFNSELFHKELEKALRLLSPYEIQELKIWLMEFTVDHPELRDCLAIVA